MSDPYSSLDDNSQQQDQYGRMQTPRQYQHPTTTAYSHTPTYAPANSAPPIGAPPGGDYPSQRPFQGAAPGSAYQSQFNPPPYANPQYMPHTQQTAYTGHPAPYSQQPPMNSAFANPLPLPAPNSGALVTHGPASETEPGKFKDPTGQVPPPGMQKPRVTATLWEDEGTLCFQVEAEGICVARREDNAMINGTKLLNVAKMTRGRRDGILKSEKNRHVVKIGPMHLKGVWIPFERALEYANKEGITEKLYPLFVNDIGPMLYQTHAHPTRIPGARFPGPAPGQAHIGQAQSTSHHHQLLNPGVSSQGSVVSLPLAGRPSLDRAHTFPTPPSSATGAMPPMASQGGGSQDWNGTYQGNSANSIALNTGMQSTRSVPATPATTPPGNLHGSMAYSTPQYNPQVPAYSNAPPQQPQYSGGHTQVHPYRPHDSTYIKHEMAPPSRGADQPDLKSTESMMPQGGHQLGHGAGTDQRDTEHDNDYTHSSAQYANRGTYDYPTNPASGNVPSEMNSGQLAGSPHQPASGSQTPRTAGPTPQWNGSYAGMGQPLSRPPTGGAFRPLQAGSYPNGDVGSPYNHTLPNGIPTANNGKRARDEDEHTSYSRPDSAQGEDVESKRRKTFSNGSVGPNGYVDHANQARNRPLVTSHDR